MNYIWESHLENSQIRIREKNVLVIEKNLLKFEAEGREFAKFLRSLEQFILTVTWDYLALC